MLSPDTTPPERRRSSPAVVIGAVSALSLAIAGCSNETVTAYCVDSDSLDPDGSYRTVDEDRCDDDRVSGTGGGAYFFYYGGNLNGSRVKGGSTARPDGIKIVTQRGTVISRGGAGGRGGGIGG
ncbi:hypothetical protein [Salinactinospora qingdaonensis]|uniref:Lipoprotein n=1 Tax=Salinactinospora qingdaonensis TaxID=702744 RepID=A0ABP7GE96_9ACTN